VLDGAKENLRARFPADRKPYTIRYDYEDDSDFEEGCDDDEPASDPQVVTVMEELKEKDVVILEKSDTKGNESSDVLSVSDLDSLFSESSDTKGETETAFPAHVDKVLIIENVAFVT
jgi:hypothetical protein